jgi:microcystin-dependent protein
MRYHASGQTVLRATVAKFTLQRSGDVKTRQLAARRLSHDVGRAGIRGMRRRKAIHDSPATASLKKRDHAMNNVLSRAVAVAVGALSLTALNGTASAQASDPFLGQIMCAGFDFAPRGWAELNGQLLSIAQNTALFALLGTQYGGNGQTTFALPDMRGRVLMHAGSGPGLTPRNQGEHGGAEQVTLSSAQLPAHNHTVIPMGSSAQATLESPEQAVLATTKKKTAVYAPGPGTVAMSSTLTTTTGGNAPVPLVQPYVTVKCFIATQGVFPARQ